MSVSAYYNAQKEITDQNIENKIRKSVPIDQREKWLISSIWFSYFYYSESQMSWTFYSGYHKT